MPAVGLTDVFKYGGKFLGYLSVVVLAGGGVLGAGAYLASTGGVALGDPSVGSLTTYRAYAGAVLVAIGALISLVGIVGLVYKFVADVITVGIANGVAAAPNALTATRAVDADEQSASDGATDGSDAEDETGDVADADEQSPDDGGPGEPDVAPSGTPEPDDTSPAEPDTEPDGTEPAPAGETRPGSPLAEAEAGDTPTIPGEPTPPANDETDVPSQSHDSDLSVAEETSTAPEEGQGEATDRPNEADWTTSEYATGTFGADDNGVPADEEVTSTDEEAVPVDDPFDDEPASPDSATTSGDPAVGEDRFEPADDAVSGDVTAPVDETVDDDEPTTDGETTGVDGVADRQDTADADDTNETGDAVTDEWTPPDPSEFEQSESSAGDAGGEENSGDEFEDRTDPESTSGTDRDESSRDEADTTRTREDIQGTGGYDGADAETGGSRPRDDPLFEDESVSDSGTDRDDAFDSPIEGGREPDDDLGPGTFDDGGDDAGDDPVDSEDDEELDEDVTLADEGVTSFEARGDDDPLADRLPGDDG